MVPDICNLSEYLLQPNYSEYSLIIYIAADYRSNMIIGRRKPTPGRKMLIIYTVYGLHVYAANTECKSFYSSVRGCNIIIRLGPKGCI